MPGLSSQIELKDGTPIALPLYQSNGGVSDDDMPKKPWEKRKVKPRAPQSMFNWMNKRRILLKDLSIHTILKSVRRITVYSFSFSVSIRIGKTKF